MPAASTAAIIIMHWQSGASHHLNTLLNKCYNNDYLYIQAMYDSDSRMHCFGSRSHPAFFQDIANRPWMDKHMGVGLMFLHFS